MPFRTLRVRCSTASGVWMDRRNPEADINNNASLDLP